MEFYLGDDSKFLGPLSDSDGIIHGPEIGATDKANGDEKFTLYGESSGDICTADSSEEPWPGDDGLEPWDSDGSESSYTDDIEPTFACWHINPENPENTEPISRDEFNIYRQRTEQTFKTLRRQRDKAQSRYHSGRAKIKHLEEQCQKDKIFSDKRLARNCAQWEANLNLREKINEPVWPPEVSESSDTRHPSSFLYDNALDAARELKARVFLTRASIAIDRGVLDLAERLIADALETAKILDYIPFEAKCRYWEAVALNARGKYEEAARMFARARPCVGKYIEGEQVDMWLKHFQSSGFNSPIERCNSPIDDDGDGNAGEWTVVDRGKRRRRRKGVLAAADIPISP